MENMDDSKKIIAAYTFIRTLSDKKGAEVVQMARQTDGMLVVKRTLPQGAEKIYQQLSTHPYVGFPRILHILRSPDDEDSIVVLEEYIEGETLTSVVSKSNVTLELLARWGIQLCDALEHLHNLNPPLIHRDIKPDNVLLTAHGQVKLLDFGIARQHDTGAYTDTEFLGTPGFVSPELFNLKQTDARSDIYSLGKTMEHLNNAASHPGEADKQEAFKKAIAKATRLDPQDRYQFSKEFKVALQSILSPVEVEKAPKNKKALVPLVVAGAVVLLAVIILLMNPSVNKSLLGILLQNREADSIAADTTESPHITDNPSPSNSLQASISKTPSSSPSIPSSPEPEEADEGYDDWPDYEEIAANSTDIAERDAATTVLASGITGSSRNDMLERNRIYRERLEENRKAPTSTATPVQDEDTPVPSDSAALSRQQTAEPSPTTNTPLATSTPEALLTTPTPNPYEAIKAPSYFPYIGKRFDDVQIDSGKEFSRTSAYIGPYLQYATIFPSSDIEYKCPGSSSPNNEEYYFVRDGIVIVCGKFFVYDGSTSNKNDFYPLLSTLAQEYALDINTATRDSDSNYVWTVEGDILVLAPYNANETILNSIRIKSVFYVPDMVYAER